jgi:pyruvate dehydrogenase E2 component (dihydrolipoamide acetyltransferase)
MLSVRSVDMATRILLPKFGQTVETSEITQWLVQEGAAIAKGTILCEIATDKSTLEVESQFAGTLLKILLKPGTTAPVGCVMALLGERSETLDEQLIAECLATQRVSASTAAAPAESAPAAKAAPPPPPPPGAPPPPRPSPAAPATPTPALARTAPSPRAQTPSQRIFISPRARRLAAVHEVPVAILAGTGEQGRIVESDVQSYLDAVGPISPVARSAALKRGLDLRGLAGSGPSGRIMLEDLARFALTAAPAAPAAPSVLEAAPPLVAKVERHSPMRRAIASNMALSSSTIPAFQLEVTADASALIARRERDKAAGVKISYGDLIAKAVALALRRHPLFAATWSDTGISYGDRVNLGFAVAIPGGLVVPVIWDCDAKTVDEIASESLQLVDKARTGKLAPADYAGGVFTLSNLGAFPVDRFVAIVPPGQSGIIAIGRIRDEVAVRNGGFFAAKLISLTLSADHRYIDGAAGAQFMKEVKELLELADRL